MFCDRNKVEYFSSQRAVSPVPGDVGQIAVRLVGPRWDPLLLK